MKNVLKPVVVSAHAGYPTPQGWGILRRKKKKNPKQQHNLIEVSGHEPVAN